ncbi:MAG TPA: HEAT repeat domain-containing protein, partial [Bacteroidales bacterium]|nr:HEAT repeat domain-containing protein [Bacteroidales bacterium]
EYLGHVGGQYAAAVLSALTGDENPDIYLAAINALGDIHHPDAIPPLVSLAKSVNDETRRYAIEALGRRDGPGTAGVLQWAALTEKDPEIRNMALKGLRAMMKQESINALLNITAYPENRERSIFYLSSLPGDKIAMVCEGLGHKHILVRTAVVEILLRNHTPQSSDMLAGCLYHGDPNVRLAAIYALHRLGNRKHMAKLMSLKEEDPDPAVRKAVGALITEG